MKKFLVFISLLFCYICSCAQKEVTILVSGDGKTKTEAVDAALRSAIEQSFGAFVSSNTVILNDELVKDEIATVSSGNIKNYKEINYFEKDGKSYVTLNATVSIEKLVSYAQSKGSSCELNGATFTAEVRRIKFYQENTKIALQHLYEQLRALAPYVYDATIEITNMKVDGTIEYTLTFMPNENMNKYENLLVSTIQNLSIKDNVAALKSKGVDVQELRLHWEVPDCESELGRQPYNFYANKKRGVVFYLYNFDFYDTEILQSAIECYYVKDNVGNIIIPQYESYLIGHMYRRTIGLFDILIPDRWSKSGTAKKLVRPTGEVNVVLSKDEYNEILMKTLSGHYRDGSHAYMSRGTIAAGVKYMFVMTYTIDDLSKITGFTVERGEYKLENK